MIEVSHEDDNDHSEVSHVDHDDDNDHSEVRPVFMFMMMMLITVH